MPVFDHTFTVPASLRAVAEFHRDTSILQKLSPPPIFVQLHHFDPLAEGAVAHFTMWFGPVPVRWQAVHHHVSEQGFTDEQVHGPLQRWQHSHRFTPLSEQHTQIHDHIEYEHPAGLRGWLTRLVFNRPGLTLLFTYRQLVTRLALRSWSLPRRSLAAAGAVALLLLIFWWWRDA